MKSRIGTVALSWVLFSGCSAGAGGDFSPGDDESAPDVASLGEGEVTTAPGAATGCPSITATLAEHAATGRVIDSAVPFFIFTFHTYYATAAPQQVLGYDPNQRVTLYAADWGFTPDAALCQGTSICGDGIVQDPEPCDGANLGGATCATLGYLGGGTVSCYSGCWLDESQCRTGCNNGVLEPGEYCDVPGEPAPPYDCTQHGYASGTIKCGADCNLDGSECVPSVCGNGIRETGEDCDGADPATYPACEDYSPGRYESGTLGCTQDCRYDTSACQRICGNGVLDPGEQCDGTVFDANHAGKACADFEFPYPTWPIPTRVKYQSGNLGCSTSCNVDKTGCKPIPGCYAFTFKGLLYFQCF